MKDAFDSNDSNMVIRSFKKCGISNYIDEYEVDAMFDKFIWGPTEILDLSMLTNEELVD